MSSEDRYSQKLLSENLKLLHLLIGTCDDLETDGLHHTANKDEKKEVTLLDTVATVLTSGRQGDVTAVALENNPVIGLVIAKNRIPNVEDEAVVRQFMDLVEDPGIQRADQVFPFMLSHCRENMRKRIDRLEKSFINFKALLESSDTLAEGTTSHLQRYTPLTIDEEFPQTKTYRSQAFENEPSFEVMLMDVIDNGILFCSQCVLDPNDPVEAQQNFSLVCLPTGYILKSRFLKTICDVWWGGGVADLQRCARRLRRRAIKIRQYQSGVDSLLKNVRRIFPNGKIPWRWAEPQLNGSSEGQVALCEDFQTVVVSIIVDSMDGGEKILAKLAQDFPHVANGWSQQDFVDTCVHAEIRLILDLDREFQYDSSLRRREQKVIGCSKRSCLCCSMWINLYNGNAFKTTWLTGGSSGTPDPSWALPGTVHRPEELEVGLFRGMYLRFDSKIGDEIKTRLGNMLYSFASESPDDSFEFDEETFKNLTLRVTPQ